MPSVLVTGGAGFIGANFVHFWLARHPDDAVVVLEPAGPRPALRHQHPEVRGELGFHAAKSFEAGIPDGRIVPRT